MLLGPERRLVRALAERLMPAEVLAASRSPEALLEGFLGGCGPEQAWAFRGALVFVQWSPWLFQVSVDGGRLPRRFTSLDETGRLHGCHERAEVVIRDRDLHDVGRLDHATCRHDLSRGGWHRTAAAAALRAAAAPRSPSGR